jgi:RNA polymerase sigma-70 factor (ECF subfamily)
VNEPVSSSFELAQFEERFDELFRVAVRPAMRILGDVHQAEDVAAEVLARCYVDWARLGGTAWVEAWIVRAATNLAIDHIRRARRPARPTIAEGSTGGLEVRLDLGVAVARLPRRQRQAVALRYFGDLSEQEVAALLGISVGSVKTHLHRAMANLRDQLGDAWRESLAFE